MTTRRPRRPNNNNFHPSHPQPSDYDSDYQNYVSDTQQQQEIPMPPHPIRSNEELNIAVLRRHNPTITSILSLAPYAVIYIFSPTTRQWEKTGVEGSLFVCQLSQGPLGEERYSVFVLNRRGLNNFDIPLTDGDNVEITEEYVILKVDNESGLGMESINNVNGKSASNGDLRIYGLWIYSEPPPNSTAETRSINAQVIRECAVHAGQSLKLARERLEATRQNGLHAAAAAAASTAAPVDELQTSVPMGRQVSLRDLFGQQRAQDDGWSTRAHHLGPQEWHQPAMGGPVPNPQPQQDVLGNLFRRAGLAYQGGP
ncbi:hypothetical protein BDV29DRAFT_101921 [Aspergillus leporis]|jgi:hypothetical protein|uniref:Decapping enzyme Dcp1 n=1 Tax=Aspergillus leporis TaxID=41062 RepID=A0A5N5WFX5_9EURO|nr:hypothetical protein BDV29DRAFT_101921 [Aspergillus leporis]